jgi:hypothetical protein
VKASTWGYDARAVNRRSGITDIPLGLVCLTKSDAQVGEHQPQTFYIPHVVPAGGNLGDMSQTLIDVVVDLELGETQ